MGFRDAFMNRRLGLTGRESAEQISGMENFFEGGKKWTRGAYSRSDGTKCLVGAADYVGATTGNNLGAAKHWLKKAIAEREVIPGFPGVAGNSIEGFNDTRGAYQDVSQLMARAKQMALEHSSKPPAQPAQPQPAKSALPRQRPASAIAPPKPATAHRALPYQQAVHMDTKIDDFIDVEWQELRNDGQPLPMKYHKVK